MADRTNILYVEDDDLDSMAIERHVKSHSLPFDLERASSCSEAVELLDENRYDLVLLDYLLPDGTGLEMLERVKGTPVIFVTGSGDETVAVRALKGGASDYLIKDPERHYLELLPATIEKAMRTFRLEQEHIQFERKIVEQKAELERLYEEVKELSLHDPLTGLANRRLMEIELSRGMAASERYGLPLSVIMLDIDHFKIYNDTYGHPAGDRLLADIAGLLSRDMRGSDLLARYGGEEFIMLLPDTDLKGAYDAAEKIRKVVEEGAAVTVSLGVASWDEAMTEKELINAADVALYRAKRSGRNRVEKAGEADAAGGRDRGRAGKYAGSAGAYPQSKPAMKAGATVKK